MYNNRDLTLIGMKYKILNTLGDYFAPKGMDILNALGDVNYKDVSQDEFLKIVNLYDIIVVGVSPLVNKEAMDAATNLKVIAVPANTLENIDVEYAKQKGIEVISLVGELEFLNTITGTAELACGLMIDITRFTPWAFDDVKKYSWDRESFRGHNLYEKTLGIVGMGRLGIWMARYGNAFGMDVLFHDPYVDKDFPDVKKVSFDELLEKSDIISLHMHLNEETENMFDASAFKKMKKQAYLVNTARGKIVDEEALLNSLEKKEIAGYATDVLAGEFDEGFKLDRYPLVDYANKHTNVIIVPHIGGMTVESRERTDVFVVEKLRNKLKM